EELLALYEKEAVQGGGEGPGKGGKGPDKGKGPPDKGKGGKGGPDKGKGPPDFSGFPGKGKGGGPPRPGVILPDFLQDELEMTETQRKALADLQKDVDAKLGKILTDKQKKQLEELRERGPKGGPKDGPPPDKGPRPKD